MGKHYHLSLDENIDYYSNLALDYQSNEYSDIKENFNDLENKDILFKYLKFVSIIDSTFIMLSYMYKMSQNSIRNLFQDIQSSDNSTISISQVGVSVRLKRALEKIKFLLNCPNLDFIDVREDFLKLFPEHLFDIAFYFYWNHTQSRTKYFLNITQCGSAFKLKSVIDYLSNIIESKPSEDLVFLADSYLEFFKVIQEKSNLFNIFFRNDFELNKRLGEPHPPLIKKIK